MYHNGVVPSYKTVRYGEHVAYYGYIHRTLPTTGSVRTIGVDDLVCLLLKHAAYPHKQRYQIVAHTRPWAFRSLSLKLRNSSSSFPVIPRRRVTGS